MVGFVSAMTTILLFWKAGSEVLEGDTMAVDRAALLALRTPLDPAIPIGPTWLREVFVDVTAMGSTTVLMIVTALAAGYLLASRRPVIAAFTVTAVGTGAIAGTLLKLFYARPRPDIVPHLVTFQSASFPSGHAMNSAVVYLTLAVLVSRSLQNRRISAYLVSVAISLTLAIGFSRIYLGVHWPTDVVAGWCAGGVWAIVCSLGARALQSKKQIEGPA